MAVEFTKWAPGVDIGFGSANMCYKSCELWERQNTEEIGIDNISWQKYGVELDKNLEQLASRLKRKKYKPIPARRVAKSVK